jgi:hypothetical protein
MAVTNQQIIDYLLANPNLSDAQLVSYMEQSKISPAQLASAVNLPEGQIISRVGAAIPNGMSVTLGDTVVAPQYQYSQSGEDNQVGALETVYTSKTNGDPNYKAPVGTPIQIYSPTGEFINTVKTKKDLSFFGGIADALKDPVVQAALLGVAGGAGVFDTLFSGTPTALATEGLTLGELGLGSELGAVTNVADVVAGTQGGLLTGGAEAATAFELANAGASALTDLGVANVGAGGGLLTKTAADAAAFELQNAGASALTDLSTTQAGLLTGGKTAAELAAEQLAFETQNAGASALTNTGTNTALTTVGTKTAAEIAADKLASDAATKLAVGAGTNLLTNLNADTVSGLLQTTGSLVQSQESKDAAQKAATDITAATQAGVAGSQFRPVGMTTRFGTSNYTYDPVTGRMTSAGYQLSPEAKAAQDRLVRLAESGLQQAEGAQGQFAPLQTGAQNLFGLGNQYISQSPQDVAQNYINQQMQLLQPSREMELANLQNRLQQQGRAGLSVAQGGSLGATTPELQALYNARAQQELQLASQAQQAGQQNVLFGAGLLGQGATAMGNYYGGQQAAYSPYTTALGQVQALEGAAQQPLQMGASLAQQASLAGARAGEIGLRGQQLSSAYNTGANATFNPFAGVLTAAGNPNSMFGQAFSSLFNPTVPPVTAMSAPATSYGAGNYYGNQDVLGVWGT